MAQRRVRLTREEKLAESRQFAANQILQFYREKGAHCLAVTTSTRLQSEKEQVFLDLGERLESQGVRLIQFTDGKESLAQPIPGVEQIAGLAELKQFLTENVETCYLLDVPPLSLFANAVEAARLTDGVVFIEKYGSTKHDAFERCLALLKQETVQVCGVVTYR
ncbi:hypothetical protein LJB68_01270 [bacterium 210820-DFI.6.52]|nr:hypothetical protein [bacterium 210820-DFI.6.52]